MANNDPFDNVSIPQTDNTSGSFMTGVDNMNRVFGNMAEGTLQKGAQVLNALGVNTTPFQNQLAAYRNNLNQQLVQENLAHPTAATIGNIAGILGASQAYGGGLLRSPYLLGKMVNNAALVGAQSYLRYTDPDQTALGNAAKGAATSLVFTPISSLGGNLVNKTASYLTPNINYGNILNRATGYGLFSAYKFANSPNNQYSDDDENSYLSPLNPDSSEDTQGQLINQISKNGDNT